MPRSDRELTRLFREWSCRIRYSRNRWNRGFGKELRQILLEFGNWKNAPRGKPGFKNRGKA